MLSILLTKILPILLCLVSLPDFTHAFISPPVSSHYQKNVSYKFFSSHVSLITLSILIINLFHTHHLTNHALHRPLLQYHLFLFVVSASCITSPVFFITLISKPFISPSSLISHSSVLFFFFLCNYLVSSFFLYYLLFYLQFPFCFSSSTMALRLYHSRLSFT